MEYLETEHVEHKTNPQPSIPKEDGEVLEVYRCLPSRFQSLHHRRYGTELRPDLLPVDKNAKPSRMVGQENLAFP